MSNHNLQIALRWAAAGVSVFPVEITISQKKIDKLPRVKWRAQSTTDAEIIVSWWDQWPDSVPGIDLAKAGVVVLDGDRHAEGEDGVAALDQLFKDHNLNTSAIPMVMTPQNGGRHAWFKQPDDGEPIGNSDRAVRDRAINVRGHGGFVVAPGTMLSDGRRYQSYNGSPSTIAAVLHGTIPMLPPAIATLLRSKQKPGCDRETPQQQPTGQSSHGGVREESYAQATLDNLAKELAGMAPETGRNNELNNAAMRMGHMIAAGWIGRATVEGRLFDASVANGLVKDTGVHAVRATIKSGIDAGEKEPAPALQDRDVRPNASHRTEKRAENNNDAGPDTDPSEGDAPGGDDDFILVQAGALHEIATKGEKALIAAGAPLYARGGEIVRPIIEEVAAFKGRKTKVTARASA
jgi:hypothetical protein